MNRHPSQTSTAFKSILALVSAVLLLSGCQTPKHAAVKPHAGMSLPDTRVTLTPGDQLDIRFFYTPELNDLQFIRADGKLTLQLVGEVQAAGLTPAELQKNLEQQYAGLIEKPSVAVITRDLNHRNIFVAGSVRTPGLLPMPGHTTALAAIMQAGGFDMREADPGHVIVVRNENGKRKSYVLDLADTIKGDTPNEPFYLHAEDIVYVPRTDIVKLGQWVDQHIAQIIPQAGFSYFYNTGTGDSSIGVDTSAR